MADSLSKRNERRSKLLKKARIPDGFLTTHQFARAVDEPVTTVLEKHRVGLFKAAIHHPTQGRGRATLYSVEQIEQYKSLRETAIDPVTTLKFYSAEEAKLGFAAIRDGKSMRDLVIDLGIHPSRARAIAEDYASMGGGVFLGPETLQRILGMGLSGPTAIRGGEDIVAIITAAAAENICTCGRGPAVRCSRCVAERVGAAAASRKPDPKDAPQVNESAEESEDSDEELSRVG